MKHTHTDILEKEGERARERERKRKKERGGGGAVSSTLEQKETETPACIFARLFVTMYPLHADVSIPIYHPTPKAGKPEWATVEVNLRARLEALVAKYRTPWNDTTSTTVATIV